MGLGKDIRNLLVDQIGLLSASILQQRGLISFPPKIVQSQDMIVSVKVIAVQLHSRISAPKVCSTGAPAVRLIVWVSIRKVPLWLQVQWYRSLSAVSLPHVGSL